MGEYDFSAINIRPRITDVLQCALKLDNGLAYVNRNCKCRSSFRVINTHTHSVTSIKLLGIESSRSRLIVEAITENLYIYKWNNSSQSSMISGTVGGNKLYTMHNPECIKSTEYINYGPSQWARGYCFDMESLSRARKWAS